MDTEYYVTKKTSCKNCGGAGLIQAPIWMVYWEWYYTNNDKHPTFKSQQKWWAAQGFSDDAEIPEDQITCPDCDGEGQITTTVTLQDALCDLGETLDILVGHPH